MFKNSFGMIGLLLVTSICSVSSFAQSAKPPVVPLQALNRESLDDVRSKFNDGIKGPRVLVFQWMDCAMCLETTSVSEMLTKTPGDLTVFFVIRDHFLRAHYPDGGAVEEEPAKPWTNPWPTSDKRIQLLWDADDLMYAEIGKMTDSNGQLIDRKRLSGLGTVVVFPKEVRWEKMLPVPSYVGGSPSLGQFQKLLDLPTKPQGQSH